MKTYKTLVWSQYADLDKDVTDHLNLGYELYGNPFTAVQGSLNQFIAYCQVVVKNS